jgi:hypothetical protein
MMSAERNKVFISYSHQDREWVERLHRFLSIILADSELTVWSDAKIMPGEEWTTSVKTAIETAIIAILLISPSYLASHFIREVELPYLLELAGQNEINILPVIVESCSIEPNSPLAMYKSLGSISQPLNSLSEAKQEVALIKLAEVVYELTDNSYKLDRSKTTKAANFAFKSKESDIYNIFFEAEKKIKIKG